MCLAVPTKIESIQEEKASVSFGGVRAEVVISLTPEVKVGDWVLVHAGYSIAVVDEATARETFAIFQEMERLTGK